MDLRKFERLKATGNLPSPKGAALAVVHLCQREETSMADLAQAIKPDPAFVGRLIKAANAAGAGAHRPVAAIQEAVAMLGIPTVRALALSFSLIAEHRSGTCPTFDYQRFWSRSLATAVALQALARHSRAAPPEEAFSIGLLAGVGRLALATLFPQGYARILTEADDGAGLLVRELEAFAMSHLELTAAMLLDWGLPKPFIEPILHQEAPDRAPYAVSSRPHLLVWSLALAGAIADACLAADGERGRHLQRVLECGRQLGIDAQNLLALANQVAAEWRDWALLLDVPAAEVGFAEVPPEALPAPGQGQGGLLVLVVDDDAAIRAVLRALLQKAGHRVAEAGDGQRALDLALELQPQLMIVDWLMPGMDGLQLTRNLRQTRVGRGIYVLLLTSMEEEEKLIEAFESGVDDFMSKPLRPRVLEAHLRAGQRVVRLQQELEREREEIHRYAAELAVVNRRLEEAAMTDSLTGFANRRYIMERLGQEWAGALRHERPLACLVVDLDSFKQYNDRYGHDVGDQVLRQAARALKAGLRANDAVARVGGDEFLVVCPDTGLAAALACAERLRDAVASAEVAIAGQRLPMAVSVGVAVRDGTMGHPDVLIKRADEGLYLAKGRGRNRVGCAQRPG